MLRLIIIERVRRCPPRLKVYGHAEIYYAVACAVTRGVQDAGMTVGDVMVVGKGGMGVSTFSDVAVVVAPGRNAR